MGSYLFIRSLWEGYRGSSLRLIGFHLFLMDELTLARGSLPVIQPRAEARYAKPTRAYDGGLWTDLLNIKDHIIEDHIVSPAGDDLTDLDLSKQIGSQIRSDG
jgi:hypothetical protein